MECGLQEVMISIPWYCARLGISGIVMTDWWAKANHEGQLSDPRIHAVMAAAQNDVYMVTADAQDMQQDDMLEEFQKGNLTRGQLQRNAINILQFVLKSPAMLYEMDRISPEELKDGRMLQKMIWMSQR